MSLFDRAPFDVVKGRRDELLKLVAMFSLFFLVILAVGILRPIKNTLALDGLAETNFYQVYLVSASVILFVPIFNRLADHIPWRWLIPGVALFFAGNLVFFRAVYREGSAAFGLIFYGWYDLFAAALVTQFFMTTQLFFNSRDAKKAYPLVIAGGSIGATLGGGITGFFAERVGTPNLLLVAAGAIAVFAVCLPFVWASEPADSSLRPEPTAEKDKFSAGELRTLFANPQIRLIAASVLLTVLAKQFVDYQFNTLSERAFVDRDAIASFQGLFNAATQWLPIVVLVALRPALQRYGVGVAVLLFPVVILLTNAALGVWFGIWAATVAKGLETSVRYSAERTGREILYVPVPEEIKLRAKTYIDVALEKGVGKVLSAGLIFVLLQVVDFRFFPWVTTILATVLFGVGVAVRNEYGRTLAKAIRGRFASLRGIFASVADASTLPVLREALASGDRMQVAFVLDLLEEAGPGDVTRLAPELHGLLDHPSPQIRARALLCLARRPEAVQPEAVRDRLEDPIPEVREAAAKALVAAGGDRSRETVRELLGSPRTAVRTATLSLLVRGEISTDGVPAVDAEFLDARREKARAGDSDARLELALAAGTLADSSERARELLETLLEDPDPRVAAAALRSAGRLGRPDLYPRLIDALAHPQTRAAARDALARQGDRAVPMLEERLMDESASRLVRRHVPSALARIPTQASVQALIRSYIAPETDQLLDYRTLKALNKLRADHPELDFDPEAVLSVLEREVDAAAQYAATRRALAAAQARSAGEGRLSVAGEERSPRRVLDEALRSAWEERRESVFRSLGLAYSPDGMYRCYLALVAGGSRARANALEWLEHTIGHRRFLQLNPVLETDDRERRGREPTEPRRLLTRLWSDNDRWLARLGLWTCAELRPPWLPEALEEYRAPDRSLRELADRLRARLQGEEFHPGSDAEMDLLEKVFLLQNVDLLRGARSADLAVLASIADVVEAEADRKLIEKGEPTEALYIVIDGAVELRGVGEGSLVASDGTPFGTWALIDQEPSLISARTLQPTRLLCISRRDFHDLLADHAEMALELLQGLARRVRTLVATATGATES